MHECCLELYTRIVLMAYIPVVRGTSCEKEAVRWVELLLEPAVSEEHLVEAASHLSQRYYQDVVEERNIGGLCGYPCCGQLLGVLPKQKYHVSVERKLVLDLTERKKFCSAECYKASNFYYRQLSTVLSRSRAHQQKLLLLTATDPGSHPSHSQPTLSYCTSSELQEQGHSHQPSPSTPPLKEVEEGMESLELVEERVQLPKLSPVGKILHALNNWCTPTTWYLLQSGLEGIQVRADPAQDTVYLPPIHSMSRNQLQRNIFWQQARKSLPAVAGELGLSVTEVQSSLGALLKTFKLDRYTVTFRPAEWRLILIVLLQRLHPNCSAQVPTAWLAAVGASLDDLALMRATLAAPQETAASQH